MKIRLRRLFGAVIFALVSLFTVSSSCADVVKPALIEISAYTSGRATIEIRTSVEALLTGINAKYKNTKQSPNAEAYDQLRVLDGPALRQKFTAFEPTFLSLISLEADGIEIPLQFKKVEIPEAGYTKVPRASILTLEGPLPPTTKQLRLKYPAKFGDSAIRVRQVDHARQKWHWSEWQWIKTDHFTAPYALDALFKRRALHQVIGDYILLGFSHILPKGLDHILFILGLFYFSSRLSPLLWQVTMFTLAHTLTLGLAMAGVVDLPARIVEPLIALSIAYVGFENIFADRLKSYRLALVFLFGLLHGLGFAGILNEFGMPDGAFFTALLSFNVGVELGQLTIIALAFAATSFWFGAKPWYRQRIAVPISIAICLFGIYWTLERLLLF